MFLTSEVKFFPLSNLASSSDFITRDRRMTLSDSARAGRVPSFFPPLKENELDPHRDEPGGSQRDGTDLIFNLIRRTHQRLELIKSSWETSFEHKNMGRKECGSILREERI